VLGQPQGVSLRRELRADLVGRVDQGLLARRLRLDAEAEICPLCVARPIRLTATGLCRVCHLRELAEAHREAIDELETQRELWTARQRLKRARTNRT
jgi:DNA repair exonuclease SbcCD ATPase subunit